MTLTRFGLREWGLGLLVSVALLFGTVYLALRCCPAWGWGLSAFVVLVFLALAAFFRNPKRVLPEDPRELCSPADGVVRDIEVVDFDQAPFTGKALRIGIFLSVFDVHVNRAPAEMAVLSKVYRPGAYADARSEDCVRRNEAMTIAGTARVGDVAFPMGIRQISGAIARRIVCPVDPGRNLRRGEIYGMIKFGSRTELYLPIEGVEVRVKIGDRVKGGVSVLAVVKS